MELIFDSHAHYDDSAFDEDRERLITSLPSQGVGTVVNAGTNRKTIEKTVSLCGRHPHVYGAVGFHPHYAADMTEADFDLLKQLAQNPKIVAIGEIGLDYHYDFGPREMQMDVFRRQLALAKELSLPVIVHDREAHQDTLDCLSQITPAGVVHCFSGSVETARRLLSLGFYIGLGGAVTFKNAVTPVQVAEMVPIDRLLIETDCPYMTPVPFRGKRCDSTHLRYTVEKIAQIRGVQPDEIIRASRENARRLFGL